jgi:hypothetical protein
VKDGRNGEAASTYSAPKCQCYTKKSRLHDRQGFASYAMPFPAADSSVMSYSYDEQCLQGVGQSNRNQKSHSHSEHFTRKVEEMDRVRCRQNRLKKDTTVYTLASISNL